MNFIWVLFVGVDCTSTYGCLNAARDGDELGLCCDELHGRSLMISVGNDAYKPIPKLSSYMRRHCVDPWRNDIEGKSWCSALEMHCVLDVIIVITVVFRTLCRIAWCLDTDIVKLFTLPRVVNSILYFNLQCVFNTIFRLIIVSYSLFNLVWTFLCDMNTAWHKAAQILYLVGAVILVAVLVVACFNACNCHCCRCCILSSSLPTALGALTVIGGRCTHDSR